MRLSLLLTLLCFSISLWAQTTTPQAHLLTDKEVYLCGERVHVSVSVTDAQPASNQSTIAYVELTDARHLCSQMMIKLTEGRGWGDLILPEQLHSGNYLLSVYTHPMLVTDSVAGAAHKVLSIVNAQRASRFDELSILNPDTDTLNTAARFQSSQAITLLAGQSLPNPFSDVPGMTTLSLISADIYTPNYQQLQPSFQRANIQHNCIAELPEVEGHIISARPTTNQEVNETRLVMVGRMAAIYDGQPQPDGSYAYYTSDLHGTLPTLINAYDQQGQAVPMEFISPYAQLLAKDLPRLRLYATEAQLRERSLCAQREQLITEMQSLDSLGHKTQYQSAKPIYSYDLDEWANFSSVREILVEFVSGVRRSKANGVNRLYTIDPATHSYSQWPALVLLDGMPVYDIDEILNYDSRLLRYVHIYGHRYTFGETICQGIISFISRRGRLSNYKIDAGSRLVSYAFPQQRPVFLTPRENQAGTLYWNPDVTIATLTLPRLNLKGNYYLIWQHINTDGTISQHVNLIKE